MNIQSLSTAEKILLAEKLWESVRENSSRINLPQEQIEELNKRLEALNVDGDKGDSWNIVKERIIS
jgi:putative addiction module component (TIGR02574 family)